MTSTDKHIASLDASIASETMACHKAKITATEVNFIGVLVVPHGWRRGSPIPETGIACVPIDTTLTHCNLLSAPRWTIIDSGLIAVQFASLDVTASKKRRTSVIMYAVSNIDPDQPYIVSITPFYTEPEALRAMELARSFDSLTTTNTGSFTLFNY
jgi:hypothetical protein